MRREGGKLMQTGAPPGYPQPAGLVVLDFYAPWCVQCELQRQALDEVARRWGGRVRIERTDVEQDQERVRNFGVHEVPTLVVLSSGLEIARFVGAQSREVLEMMIETQLQQS